MAGRPLLARLRRDRSGVAAVEFALVLPLLLTMWLGMEQFSEYATADAKTLMAAQSVSDLISQLPASDTGTFTDIADAATQIMAPLPTSGKVTVDVVGVTYTTPTTPATGWRCTTTGGPAADATVPLSLADNLGSATQMAVMVNVKYAFQPTMSFGLLGTAILNAIGAQTLSERAFSQPRLVSQLTKPC
jgi:Flp pilus assembly protein TadG